MDISDRKDAFVERISELEKENLQLKHLISLFEQIPAAMFLIDLMAYFRYVNPYFTRLTGYTLEDLKGLRMTDLVTQGLVPESRAEVEEMLLQGQEWQGEMQLKYANGIEYWAKILIIPQRDEKNEITGFLVSQQEIADRKEIEKALRESEVKYKMLVENSHDGILIVRDSKILYANDTICNMIGYNMADQNIEIIHPEDRPKMLTIGERRRAGDMSTIHQPIRMIARSGEIKECETTSTLMQFEGEWASFYTVHDVTERNRFESELKKSEKKYRELTEMLPLAVYELDVNGNPTYMNLTGLKLFGIKRGSARGKTAVSFFSPEDSAQMKLKLKEEAERLLVNGNSVEALASPPVEYTAKRADGSSFPVLIYGSAIIEDGTVKGSRGIIVDISERKVMENALRESEEKYKTLIENSQDGIFAINGQRILFANSTFCRFIGYNQDELYHLNATDLLFKEDKEKGLAISKRRQQGDKSKYNSVFQFQTKTGEIREADVFSSVVELNGQLVSYITVHDLTVIRKIQEELVKSEQKYRELAEMLPQTVYELDLNANLRYLNKAGKEKFGTDYETREVSVFSIVVSDQLERMKQNFKNVSFENIPSKGNFYKLRQADGQIFEAMISATPIITNGITIGSRGVVIDISEHAAMQKALAESEEKYRSLIENATDGIVIAQNGLLAFVNKAMCDIMQYSFDEMINKPYLHYVENAEKDYLNDRNIDSMAEDNFNSIFRSQLIRKDKKTITVELNTRTSYFNGKPAAFIIVRDITERLKIENELQIAKDELERLNSQLEKRVKESSRRLTEAHTQLINLQKENLQSQYDVLKQQVNPHFLFNSLNVLTSLIKLEPDLAEKFSEQLSKVYRYVLENKDNELVDLNTELNFLDAYIFLLNIRFVDKLVVDLNVPDENRNDRIIPLAMQLLIENAIKHNVMSKSNPLMINIFIDSDNCLNVVNNLQERPSQIVSTGVGLKNILNRYQLLNLTVPTFEKTENKFIAKIRLVKGS